MPDTFVVTLFESVELAIICAAICIDLGILVPLKNTSHCPFAVYETAISDFELFSTQTTRASNRLHFTSDGEYTKALVNHDQLLIGLALLILTIAEPAHPV